jgi:ADP-heptose:LPS heptosyltransferase
LTTPPTAPPQQIAIVNVAGIGNALMAEPMARALRETYPVARISILSPIAAMAEPLARGARAEAMITGKGVRRMLAAAYAIRRRRVDLCVVPFPSNRWQYNLLTRLINARRTLIHSYPTARAAGESLVPDRVQAVRGLHDVEQNLRLLQPLGIDAPPTSPRFVPHDDETQAARQTLASLGLADQPFAAVHAGSGDTVLAVAKRWPREHYAQLAVSLRRLGLRVLLLEGPDEAGVSDQILSHIGAARDGISQIKFRGGIGNTAAVLAHARLYVGTDSGLAHLSAAVGRPAVTLFAPADPSRVCPFGQRDRVLQPGKACSPCAIYPWDSTRPGVRCDGDACVREIRVEAVVAKVRQTLETTQ